MRVDTFELDLNAAQVVYMRLSEAMSDAQHESWLAEYERRLEAMRARKHHIAFILDTTYAQPLTAQQRRIQSAWNGRTTSLVKTTTLGTAFVVPSAVARGIITAISWVQPPVVPQRMCRNLDDAIDWTVDTCEGAGVRFPLFQRSEARRQFSAPLERIGFKTTTLF